MILGSTGPLPDTLHLAVFRKEITPRESALKKRLYLADVAKAEALKTKP